MFVILHISNLLSYPGHTCVPAQATRPNASSPHIRSCTGTSSIPIITLKPFLNMPLSLLSPHPTLLATSFSKFLQHFWKSRFPCYSSCLLQLMLIFCKARKRLTKREELVLRSVFFFFFFLIPLDWEKITVMMSRSWAFTHLIHESSHLTSQSIYFLIYKMGLITVTPSSGYC